MLKIQGEIVKDKKERRFFGIFPLNIKITQRVSREQQGVYLALVKLGDKTRPALTYFIPFSFFSFKIPVCQTYILGRKKRIFSKSVELILIFKLKDIELHPHWQNFKKQLKKDFKIAKRYFGL